MLFLAALLLATTDPNAVALNFDATPSNDPNVALSDIPSPPERYFGSATWGGGGIHRVMLGHDSGHIGLSVAGGIDFATANSFLLPGDHLRRLSFYGALVWAPTQRLELGIVGDGAQISDDAFSGSGSLQLTPTLRAKVHALTWHAWDLAAAVVVKVPSASSINNAVSVGDAAYAIVLVGSRALHPRLELAVNLGFIYDRTRYASGISDNPAQRYASGVVAANRALLGVGASGLAFVEPKFIAVTPYVEVNAQWVPSTALGNNPVSLSLGSKQALGKKRAFEVDLGCDIRLVGTRVGGASPYPAELPWTVFANLKYYTGVGGLSFGERDRLLRAYYYRAPTHTWVVTGTVKDTQVLVLGNASITIQDNNAIVSTHPVTGAYVTPPMVTNGNTLTVTAQAPGYEPESRVLQLPT